ncbi:MAG: hypothetical protein GEU26_12170 [Nitrososphaeraceae archaeon]|nr:hypothetical protein [Nitrososphaeraceae archaeon]
MKQRDKGSSKNTCSVDIAWFLGKVREFKFDISISNDGTSFTKVRSGTSSGTTTAFEKYILPAGTEARYIRITVNGNDVTTYGNTAEIAVFGSAGESSPTLAGSDAEAYEKFDVSYSEKLIVQSNRCNNHLENHRFYSVIDFPHNDENIRNSLTPN